MNAADTHTTSHNQVSPYHDRRMRLLSLLPVNSLALIASGDELVRNRDTYYEFRPHSDFFYLTGFAEPEAVLLLKRTTEAMTSVLLLRERNPDKEAWEGIRLGTERAVSVLGVDKAVAISELTAQLTEHLANTAHVFISYEQADRWMNPLISVITPLKKRVRQGISAPSHISDLDPYLHEDRLIKDQNALTGLRRAAEVTIAGHLAAMKATTADRYEYEVQAALEYECRRLGAKRQAFDSIVASGKNACILHYHENKDRLKSGDLLLIDAGAEVDGYAGDCTHTFPIGGKFSSAQSAIYDLVLSAQQAAMAEIKVNQSYISFHEAGVRVITQGLIDLQIIPEQDLTAAIEQGLYKPFYRHQTGHWLGCDVHDVGLYQVNHEWRRLQEQMVVTVEPGIYLSSDCVGLAEKWHGIGIRIEDSVIITNQGYDIITTGLPRTRQEIESCMKTACTHRTIGKWVGKILPKWSAAK